ncbi:dTDP-4-amino-4,6-dideoxy-D-glucose transaminase [Flavobacteriales bacterium]|nr:dTDP-4-amino-4,6-dideoxy-D-glucose transaminase [Flavobacteriales bacterium]
MLKNLKKFSDPIYVTRPLLPDLNLLNKKLEEIWSSNWLTNNGPQHQLFERKIREYLKVPQLSLFNNGTIALVVGCQSLRITGEVITTPFTFPATPHVLTWNNIKPIFCDIDPVTLNIDSAKIESMITPQTTAILGVHVFGTPCDVKGIQEIADRYGLKVMYDAAHAFGAEIDNIGIGNYGDITMFSFHATKLFHTAEGGALVFKDKNLKQRVDYLKNFGIKNEDEVVMPGINGKMNEIQSALGLLVLEMVEGEKQKRKLLKETYIECLKDVEGITVVNTNKGLNDSYQYFVIRINEKVFGMSRDSLYGKLKEYNVFTRKYFYPLCSEYSCYKNLPSSSRSNLPIANQVVGEVLCMPFYGGLKVDEVEIICNLMKNIQRSK